MWTQISGTRPASSQASRELSTASFTAVSRALRGLTKPSRWRFFAKNSLTEMSRCLVARVSAVTFGVVLAGGLVLVILSSGGEKGSGATALMDPCPPWRVKVTEAFPSVAGEQANG